MGVVYFWPGFVRWIISVPSFSSFFTTTDTLESPPMACARMGVPLACGRTPIAWEKRRMVELWFWEKY